MIKRLQLGTSRFEDLDVRVLEPFLDSSWMHLGDAEPRGPRPGPAAQLQRLLHDPRRFLALAVRAATGRLERPHRPDTDPAALYARTHFEPFYYRKGDRLPFADGTFDYIFSEHFFHHLFFDEAFALFEECRRLLSPHGVLRTVVPDADLRTYEPPEPVGFPDPRLPFGAPLKHKTRYSVYLLVEALRLAGLSPVPLRYCDRHGTYVRRDPRELESAYTGCPERRFVFDLAHVLRLDSLIVDGVNHPLPAGSRPPVPPI